MVINDGGKYFNSFFQIRNKIKKTNNFQLQKQEENQKSWSLIFYEYLSDDKYQQFNVLTPQMTQVFKELLQGFKIHLPQDLHIEAEVNLKITFYYFYSLIYIFIFISILFLFYFFLFISL